MKPLDNLVVLDLTRAIAGPYCTLYFADLGATVIKIENPNDPDFIRDYTPTIGPGSDGMSAPFAQYNRNKLSVTLDLGRPEAQDIFRDMVRKADILIENYRPGVMEKFGLHYQALKTLNPRLVYTAISGYGQDGPYRKRPAYDSCAQALSGLWSLNGPKDGPAVRVGTIISDLAAGLNAVIGTLAALRVAQATGQGQMVDVAQLDSTLALTGYAVPNYTAGGILGAPLGDEDSNVRPFESFATRDGQVFFGGFNDKFFHQVCAYFGEPELARDPEIGAFATRNLPEVYARRVKPKLAGWFASRTTAELEAALADQVPLAPIKNIAEALADPQVKVREMIVTTTYPEGSLDSFALPIKFSETPANSEGLAPRVGQHNDKVYRELVGLSGERLAALKDQGIL
ncbi:CoA transferase [Pseudomonas sp. RIT-PI-AD]|uniref:CaiB/BaiF CoA transferase family protein n=1 Tax=Pseudomonas sp. RIT-PI-AD TaxID=3035294 RepID=UPI0021DA74F6|nr:CoA transferase [Pseudomonas sp. RIT-PI-AD]